MLKSIGELSFVTLVAALALIPTQLVSGQQRICATETPLPNVQRLAETAADGQKRENRELIERIDKIAVPVWVHVITDGATGRVSEAAVNDQIKALNQAFNNIGASFFIVGQDTSDNPKWHTMGHRSTAEREAKSSLAQNPATYLNLYLAAPGGGVLGWATWPWDLGYAPEMDGVVVRYDTLPGGESDNYNEGKTCVHEVGHWLGLYHTFQGGCDEPGDYCNDTPAEARPAYETIDERDSCPDKPGLDPVHNYMNYSFDIWLTEFTKDQDNRMINQIVTYRPGLLEKEHLRNLNTSSLASFSRDRVRLQESQSTIEIAEALDAISKYRVEKGLATDAPVVGIVREEGKVLVEYQTSPDVEALIGPKVLIYSAGKVSEAPRR